MAALLVSLPMQLACQIMCAANSTSGNLTFVQNTPISRQNVSPLPDGYTSFPDIGVAYKSYSAKLVTWDVARRRCIEDGATMAVIDSMKKQDYVMKVKSIHDSPHVGIHRLFNKDEWTSLQNGLPTSLVPWAPNEPDHGSTTNCGAMWGDGRGIAAEPCSDLRSFLCEIPIPKDDIRMQ